MTEIKVLKNKNKIVNVEIKGHTNFKESGKDIVCASISAIATTTVNAILRLNENSISYQVDDGYLKIAILSHDSYTDNLIINMVDLFKTLAKDYPKNVKINI